MLRLCLSMAPSLKDINVEGEGLFLLPRKLRLALKDGSCVRSQTLSIDRFKALIKRES